MKKKVLEMPGIEPGASHMQSERSTTELHPPVLNSEIDLLYMYALLIKGSINRNISTKAEAYTDRLNCSANERHICKIYTCTNNSY